MYKRELDTAHHPKVRDQVVALLRRIHIAHHACGDDEIPAVKALAVLSTQTLEDLHAAIQWCAGRLLDPDEPHIINRR